MTREEFDALLAAAVKALLDGLPTANPVDLPSLERRHHATQEVQLLEAEAREFADAVDHSGKGIPYGDAVVIEGSSGPLVIAAADYETSPVYWRITAGGHIDRVVHGPDLLPHLQAAVNRAR